MKGYDVSMLFDNQIPTFNYFTKMELQLSRMVRHDILNSSIRKMHISRNMNICLSAYF